jgi:hypothetical protein
VRNVASARVRSDSSLGSYLHNSDRRAWATDAAILPDDVPVVLEHPCAQIPVAVSIQRHTPHVDVAMSPGTANPHSRTLSRVTFPHLTRHAHAIPHWLACTMMCDRPRSVRVASRGERRGSLTIASR